MHKITIAIPLYNVENDIEKALYSALKQMLDDIEFLIINNYNTNNSLIISL